MKGREPVEGPAVGVSLAVKEQLGHAHVPAVRGNVQGGQVVYRHLHKYYVDKLCTP